MISDTIDTIDTICARPPAPAAKAAVVSLDTLRVRFGLRSRRAARALMRKMRHVSENTSRGEIWTTEAWIAEWLAARCVQGLDKAAARATYDPLEEAVIERTVRLVGELARRGVIRPTEGINMGATG